MTESMMNHPNKKVNLEFEDFTIWDLGFLG